MQKRRHARRCTRKGVEVIGSEEVVMARLGKRIKLKLLENHVRNRLKTEWLVGDLSLEREGRLMGSLAVMIAAHALQSSPLGSPSAGPRARAKDLQLTTLFSIGSAHDSRAA